MSKQLKCEILKIQVTKVRRDKVNTARDIVNIKQTNQPKPKIRKGK